MNRRTASILTFTFATTLGVLLLGRGHADADNCGGADLCACGDTVVADHTLGCGIDPVTVDVCPGTGLAVLSGVALDLGGCTIRGSGIGDGVHLFPGEGMSVSNGRIRGFDNGLQGSEVVDLDVSQLQLLGNRAQGIALDQVRGSTIEQNIVATNGGSGIVVVGGDNVVQFNRAEGNGGVGFSILGQRIGLHGNVITRNIARRNTAGGFFVRDFQRGAADTKPTTTLNRAEFNGDDGFVFEGDFLFVSRNVSDRNQGAADGFHVRTSTSTFAENRLTNNPGYGIHNQGLGNTYDGNVCSGDGLGPSFVPGFC